MSHWRGGMDLHGSQINQNHIKVIFESVLLLNFKSWASIYGVAWVSRKMVFLEAKFNGLKMVFLEEKFNGLNTIIPGKSRALENSIAK